MTPLGKSVPTATNGSVAPLAPDPAAQLRTIRALRDEAFDVLHIHEPMCPGPTMTALLVRSAPVVATFHRSGDSVAYALAKPAVRWLARRIDLRCAVSPDALSTAQRALGSGEYQLLFNGIEVERFAKAEPYRASDGHGPAEPGRDRDGEGPTIFFIGRHEERKGLAVLLDAMAQLPASAQVWVGGVGPQTESLQAKHGADPRISWLGRLSDGDVASRLAAADVFCAPSISGESFGVVLLEAMAAGAAVVASALDGYRNVATDGLDSVLVPPGDAEALGDALIRVLDNDGFRQELVTAGHVRANSFAMTRLADAYLDCYRRVIG